MSVKEINAQIANLTPAQIEALQASLKSRMVEAKAQSVASVRAKVEEILAKNGLTIKDLRVRKEGARTTWTDPATGAVYQGRGPRPEWLKSLMASGKSLEDLADKTPAKKSA